MLAIASCQTKQLSTKQKIATIKKLDVMLGTWATFSSVYTVVETWKKVNDTTLKGRSIMVMSGDTVLNERMSIQPTRRFICLNSKNLLVPESEFESFRLAKLSSDKIHFEKTGSEKSESITYNFISPETMRILFQTKGKSVESYNMKKIMKK
jgi:hypothetical protein